ncbi:MAG TPA: response regulator transcription factor [Actinomycetota bacterium]|jgi:DNA-binding NarL/FixJ family response regulator
MSIRVLVVDDHPIFREALVRALSWVEGIRVVGEATGGVAACGSAVELDPDVILMDLSMGDLSGIDAMQRIHRRRPEMPVVFLTARGDAGLRREALGAGGAGYVTKGAMLVEIVEALRAALPEGARSGERPSVGVASLDGPEPPTELDQELLGQLGMLVEQGVEVP